MRPMAYVDFLFPESGDMAIPVMAGKVLGIFHRFCASTPGIYAMAFPHMGKSGDPSEIFETLRIFADTRDNLTTLVQNMKKEFLVRDYTAISRPRVAPEKADTWACFTRFRVPKEIRSERLNKMSRAYRYNLASTVPFLPCFSSSTQQHFRLYIERFTVKGPERSGGTLDSYGLSHNIDPLFLPVF